METHADYNNSKLFIAHKQKNEALTSFFRWGAIVDAVGTVLSCKQIFSSMKLTVIDSRIPVSQ